LNLTSYIANKCFEYLLKYDANPENADSRSFITRKSCSTSHFISSPPWAVEPILYKKNCNGCGVCVSACEKNIIIVDKDGLAKVDFSKGSCSLCGVCAQTCPQEALSYAPDRPPWYLNASITAACLMNNKVLCSTCIEHCDKKAIVAQRIMSSRQAPRVLPGKCNGCGACFAACPVSAIAIEISPSKPNTGGD